MDVEKARKLLKNLITLTEKEAKRKQDIAIQLRKLADELDVKQRDMNIAKTAFASGGIVGTGLTIAGIVAAPFTFGASLGLTVGGIAVGVSSGLGGLATTIADWLINNNTMEDAQAMVDEYKETVNDLVDLLQQVKNTNTVEFESLVSEQLKNMDAAQRLTLESVLNGIRTSVEVTGSVGRSTAVAGAVAARATIAAGKTMMETLETGMKVVKIGGVVLSVLTVPLDLHTMITNSMKIHKNAPSETAEEIRNLATQLEKYKMVSSCGNDDNNLQTSSDEVKMLKQEVENALPDIRKMEQADEDNRRRTQKLNRHLRQLVEKVPAELNKLAVKYDQTNNALNGLKIICLFTQVLGTIIVVTVMIWGQLGLEFGHSLVFGVTAVIGGGLLHLMLEMYTELTNSSVWTDAETELDRYMHTIQVLTDLETTQVNGNWVSIEDVFGTFRTNLHNGLYMMKSHLDFTLIAVKLLLDIAVLVYSCNTSNTTGNSTGMLSDELIPVSTALASFAYPLNIIADMQIGTAGTVMYILTLPVSVYLLQLRLGEMRGERKSKIADAMKNLGEDFCIRFGHLSLE